MTAHRGWYVAALVAAVLTLLVSMGAAAALVVRHAAGRTSAASAPEWRRGPAVGGAPGGMMGRGRGGMMGGWDGDEATVTVEQATTSAQAWLDSHEAGATLGRPLLMPMGYLFTVTQHGAVIGTVMVNDDTGQLVWMAAVQPSPSASAS